MCVCMRSGHGALLQCVCSAQLRHWAGSAPGESGGHWGIGAVRSLLGLGWALYTTASLAELSTEGGVVSRLSPPPAQEHTDVHYMHTVAT